MRRFASGPGLYVLRPALVFMFSISLLLLCLPGPAAGEAYASPTSGWVEQTPHPDGEDLFSVSAADADTAWAVGNYSILNTVDGGANWTDQEMLNNYSWTVGAVDKSKVWVMGSVDDTIYDNIQWSANGGNAWTRVNARLDARAYLYDVAALDGNTIWAAGSGETIIKTTNGGWTWTLQNYITPIMDELLMGISAVDSETAWVAGNFGTILRTTDGGDSWVELDAPHGLFSDVSAVDSDTAWVVGSRENILMTADGGESWVTQHSSASGSLSSISAVDAYTAWAVGTWDMMPYNGEYSIVLKTTDGGDTWVPQDPGIDIPLYDICALDASTAWAVGKDGVIVKTSGGGDALPDIVSLSPVSGDEGTQVTVTGCDFGGVQGSSHVSFGGVQAVTCVSWSDSEIVVEVPGGVTGTVPLTVTTPEGTSNPKDFTVYEPLAITAITPNEAAQNAITVEISDIAGSGFQTGAAVRFEQGERVIDAYDVNVVSGESIACKIGLFLEPPGAYDVVVRNPDGSEARLEDCFTVNPTCGQGSGAALLMLGLTLGLLSLAGSSRLLRGRKKG